MITDDIHTKVVGLTFHDEYPNSILEQAPDFPGDKPALLREPENPYDANAIAVVVGDVLIGHLPATLAVELAPEIDAGVHWKVDYAEVLVSPENIDHPGVSLLLTH